MDRKSLIILSALAYYLHVQFDNYRFNSSYLSGLALLLVISCLSLYAYRHVLTLFGAKISVYKKLHSYFGYIALILFIFHLNFTIPTGNFEIILALIFLFITFTGIFGEYLNKSIAKKLSNQGKEYLYEEIPQYRNEIIEKYQNIISDAAQSGVIATINADLLENLFLYFSSSANIVSGFLNRNKSNLNLLRDLNTLTDSNNKNLALSLIEIYKDKEALDYSYANQFILKYWRILHTGIILAFILLIFFHVYLVYAFRIK